MREEERRTLESAHDVVTTDDYRAWTRRCEKCLATLRERCLDASRRISTGARTSQVARILRVIGARNDLRRRFEREGAGVARREDDGGSGVESREGFSWSEVETAFKRRVLTGAVINLDYIEPLRFLEDARDTVLRRVRDVMGRYRSVKVNTTFNGEFVSGDKIAVKTIASRNHPLLPTTDLREWYDTRVVGDTVASLEEFQERDSGWALSRILDLTVNVNVCMHYFRTSQKLSAHSEDFGKLNDCAIVLPGEDDRWLDFEHHSKKERIPFAVYADLECALERKEGDEGGRTKNTRIVQHHRVHSVAYYTRCSFDDAASAYGSYCGEDCVAWFVRELRDLALRAKVALDDVIPMADLTSDERETFAGASRCHACERPFEAGDARVRDHCHLTGRFRDSTCNLNYKDPYVIPVFFHNLSGYDAHFIIKDVANAYPGSVELLPVTKESYIAFSKTVRDSAAAAAEGDGGNVARSRYVKLRFVDSFKFLGAGLDKLASYLDESKLTIARGEFRDSSDDDFRLLTHKGVFPYEYVDSVERLRETRLLPRESFYSSLTGDTTDVLLLADVFENFRAACLESYGLDPAYYFTLPGYTWDAMLKYTGVRFELLTDVDMMMFVEHGIRGGLSQCSNRYARANNKYMSAYDPSRPSIYLMYLDINSLYGWAMCQPLPYERFEWVDDLESLDVMSVTEDSTVGYILEVDLDYPADAHDADLPFCPTRDKPPGKRQSKLLATLYDKRRYVTHYRNLQQCVRHGRLTRIHRALRFSQSPWLHGYVELNTRLRANASNDFEKNLYKLMNNAVFGKTMENVRNRVDVRLATRWDGRFGAEALISKPNFHSRSVFSENLMAVELRKLEVKIDKPIYVGIVECEDAYERMKRDIDRFDTSDYAVDNSYGVPRANKKVLGLMKDENNGALMLEFVGLRAKMYALRVEGRGDTKKSKGVRSSVVARTLTFDDYERCLRREIEMTREQSCLKSKLHEVYTVRESKVALSPYDDKRYVVPDSTDTLPWGHYRIPL
ncbi:uncharacterized protein LOC112637159 [Camponotus floridanus]|uniref:uncharacterized protein LOC112637159 n=1 Tax=Camponotus floridanus TaxID=104421 RepID=UPI000DC6BBBF|nr:uncharacterized protein LOC112637159 [Camponotus floridanus]